MTSQVPLTAGDMDEVVRTSTLPVLLWSTSKEVFFGIENQHWHKGSDEEHGGFLVRTNTYIYIYYLYIHIYIYIYYIIVVPEMGSLVQPYFLWSLLDVGGFQGSSVSTGGTGGRSIWKMCSDTFPLFLDESHHLAFFEKTWTPSVGFFSFFCSWEYAVSGVNASNQRGSLSSTCAVVDIVGEPGGETCRHREGNLPQLK